VDRIQIISVLVTAGLFFGVFELVRRRRLMERYALLWLISSLVLLLLASWTGLLEWVAETAGIKVPSNALFVVGFAFVLALLLNFSLAISRLSDESKVLAQQVARLDHEAREARAALARERSAGQAPIIDQQGEREPASEQRTLQI
jgi:hypothetical protein